MIGPYWMALFNVIVSVIFLAGFFAYRRYFPKKKINYLILLVLISLLPCISIFRTGVYQSGDFVYHIYRAMAFYDALRDGVFIPSWAANLNSGYGYPVFIFIYNIPYYVFALFHFVGFTFIFSERILLSLSFIFSGIFMFVVLKKMTKNDLAAFAGAIVYLFAPYHFVDLNFRVSIAEVIAFVLAPAIFYFVLKLQEDQKIRYVLWLGLLFGLFFLDHPAQFIFYSGLFFAFIFYQKLLLKKKIKSLFLSLTTAFLIGMVISSYAWLARFTLTQFTYGGQLIHTAVSYVKLSELLFSPWRFGFLFQGPNGELSFAIGYTQILVLGLAIFLLFKHKFISPIQKQLLFWTSLSLIMIFLMLSYSKPIWDVFPLLNLMQFSYRLLHPLVFCLSIITGYLVLAYKNKKVLVYAFVLLTIGYTFLNWGNRGMISSINDSWIKNNLIFSTAQGEGMFEGHPIWWTSKTDFWISEVPKSHIEILQGSAKVKEIKRTSIDHSYIVYASTSSTLLENTFYFPDWTIRVDSKPVQVNYKTSQYPARMVFNISKGLHYIQVQYLDIPLLQSAKNVSLITVLLITIYSLFYGIRSLKRKMSN